MTGVFSDKEAAQVRHSDAASRTAVRIINLVFMGLTFLVLLSGNQRPGRITRYNIAKPERNGKYCFQIRPVRLLLNFGIIPMQRMVLSVILRNAVDFARPVLLSLMGTII